jgi:hypothetical protein
MTAITARRIENAIWIVVMLLAFLGGLLIVDANAQVYRPHVKIAKTTRVKAPRVKTPTTPKAVRTARTVKARHSKRNKNAD